MFLRRLSNAVALLLNSFGTLVTPRLILFSTHDFRALLSIHAAFYAKIAILVFLMLGIHSPAFVLPLHLLSLSGMMLPL